MNWESQLGRRFKLRDLHVFFTVVQRGSMAKAAQELGVSQPAVSEVIADLEHAVGVRLLDRSPQGVEPTMYGRALLRRSIAVFDELKQSVRDIEFLSDPNSGELRIGCSESIAAILSPIVQRFLRQYPGVTMDVDYMTAPIEQGLSELRNRKFDLLLARLRTLLPRHHPVRDDLNVESLFDDRLVVAAGARSRWANRREIELAELSNEHWILPAAGIWGRDGMAELFQAEGMDLPKVSVATLSVPLRIDLVHSGKFVTVLPRSLADRYALKVLPVDLPLPPWPISVMTLKNRTLSPVAERFIEHVRDYTRPMRAGERTQPRRNAPAAGL